MVHNTWVLEVIKQRTDEIAAIARTGFINQGRGAVWLELSGDRFWIVYKPQSECEEAKLAPPRAKALLEAIVDYNPLNRAIVMAFSSLGESFESITCLIKLE